MNATAEGVAPARARFPTSRLAAQLRAGPQHVQEPYLVHTPATGHDTRPTRRGSRPAVVAAALAALFLGTLGNVSAAPARAAEQPVAADCPPALAEKATCYTGQDTNGAHYAMAVPHRWNGSLVVHAHGGPDLGDASDPARSTEDLERWAVMVDQGYAWAASSYRRGGYGARMAAADTENVRRLFTRTVLAARIAPTCTASPGAGTSPPRPPRPTAAAPAPTTGCC